MVYPSGLLKEVRGRNLEARTVGDCYLLVHSQAHSLAHAQLAFL